MLFRGPSTNYNAQIHTEELSLTSQMDKDFAVHNQVLSKFERYCKFTSFLYHTGRVNGGARKGWIRTPQADQIIHDNAYRVKMKSINIKPAFMTGGALFGGWFQTGVATPDMTAVTTVTYTGGITSGTVQHDVIGSIAVKHEINNNMWGDKFNPLDVITLDGGLGIDLWIQRVRPASTGDHYILDFKVIGKASDFDEDHITEDEVCFEGGNRVGEGSLTGYQRHSTSYWKIYYSFASRQTLRFTGNSLDQRKVVWANKTQGAANSGQGDSTNLWQYEKEWEADEYFGIFLELACRYSNGSMDPSTHAWYENSGKNLLTMSNMIPEAGILPPRTPDGWVRQFKDTIDLSYDVNAGLSPYLIEGIMNILSNNSPAGATGNTFVLIGDAIAYDNWDKGMKKLMGWNVSNGAAVAASHNGQIVYNVESGAKVKLGFVIESYTYKNNEIMFMQDELLSHPGLNKRNGGLVGRGDMYFLNVTTVEGVSNFELFARGKGRYFKKKYVNGMHSLNDEQDASSEASSGFDGAFVHYLAELFPIVYFEDTCAILRGTGTYNGGALSGNSGLSQFPAYL